MKPHPEKFYLTFIDKIQLKHTSLELFKCLFIIMKLIPAFLITHDWNILHTKGISKYLFELTLGPLIHRINNITVLTILLTLFLLLSLIPCIILLVYYHRFKKYDFFLFNKRPPFKVCVHLVYFVPFLLSQYIFSLCVEIFFMKDHDSSINNTTYIFYVILSSFLILLLIAISLFLSAIFIGSFYTTGSVLVTDVGIVETKWIFFSLCQGISQLEFHIDFKIMMYIKSALRGLYAIFYVYFLIRVGRSVRCRNEIVNLILGMCFVSSIGEFAAMYSFNDDLVVLSSNVLFVMLKIIIEVFVSMIILTLIHIAEKNSAFFIFNREIDSKRHITNKRVLYPMFAKFIMNCSNLEYTAKNLKFAVELINKFQNFLVAHKENCANKKGCYCHSHRPETIKNIFNEFVHVNETRPKKKLFSFKDFCPALFDYVEFFLLNEISKAHTVQNGDLILVLILFFLNVDQNYNQSYYYLDKFLYSAMYKNSFVMKLQVELLKKKMKKKTKSEAVYDNKNGLTQMKFRHMIYFIEIQKEIQISFELYYDFLIKTSLNDLARNTSFEKTIKKISKKLMVCKKIIAYYIENYKKETTEKTFSFQLCSKLTLYYKFFYGKVPSKLKIAFEPLANYLNVSKFNTTEKSMLLTFSTLKGIQINLKNLSDSLLFDLGYDSHSDTKLDFFADVLFTQYASVYETYIITEILKGSNKVEIPYILLKDKNHFLKI